MSDIDEVVVERAVAGDYDGKLNPAEKREVVRRLLAEGFTGRQIAERLGHCEGWIRRIRKTLPPVTYAERKAEASRIAMAELASLYPEDYRRLYDRQMSSNLAA
jgi:hypothetical protein